MPGLRHYTVILDEVVRTSLTEALFAGHYAVESWPLPILEAMLRQKPWVQ